jgi:DNA-binding transcriptional regulator PaaX
MTAVDLFSGTLVRAVLQVLVKAAIVVGSTKGKRDFLRLTSRAYF